MIGDKEEEIDDESAMQGFFGGNPSRPRGKGKPRKPRLVVSLPHNSRGRLQDLQLWRVPRTGCEGYLKK